MEVSSCFSVNTLNISSFNTGDFKFFPNPVKSILTVELPPFNQAEVSIVTINGEVVLTQTLEERATQLELSELSDGVYFVILEVDGQKSNQKLIKE